MSAAHAPEVARPTLVDPTSLVLGENVRRTVVMSTAFKRDVAENGVRQPIAVKHDALGNLQVVTGQRRTLAAVEAGLPSVPVYLVDDIADEAARIVEQLGENHHRLGITQADDVAAVAQLALFGWSPAKIAKRTHRPKDDVTAALALAEVDEGTRTAVHGAGVDLVTAAKIADVAAGDVETAERLVEAAIDDPSDIDHEIERTRRDIAEREAVENRQRELRAQGVTVLDVRAVTYGQGARAENLSSLTDKPNANGTAPALDVTEHQMSCPGHAVYVWARSVDDVREETYCTSWREHAHFNRHARNTAGATSGATPEEATAERRRVIANGKAAEAAETVRREFIRSRFVGRAVKPTDAEVQHAALMIAIGNPHEFGVHQVLDDLVADASTSAHVKAIRRSPDGGKRYLLEAAMAIGEDAIKAKGELAFWRRPAADNNYTGAPALGATHLRFLADAGYGLSELEHAWLDAYETKEA
ncbi:MULTISPECIES: ParB/RepB/Spo0J family partition protein [unclassified Isoptericola]|uniref:ParB/RepB/Spo0J family partition protein n=1 Tax=unclassified Isoptericola TaxID=2623355 RepID=UPI00365AAD55